MVKFLWGRRPSSLQILPWIPWRVAPAQFSMSSTFGSPQRGAFEAKRHGYHSDVGIQWAWALDTPTFWVEARAAELFVHLFVDFLSSKISLQMKVWVDEIIYKSSKWGSPFGWTSNNQSGLEIIVPPGGKQNKDNNTRLLKRSSPRIPSSERANCEFKSS